MRTSPVLVLSQADDGPCREPDVAAAPVAEPADGADGYGRGIKGAGRGW